MFHFTKKTENKKPDLSETPVPCRAVQSRPWCGMLVSINSSTLIPSNAVGHKGKESCLWNESIAMKISPGRKGISCFHKAYQTLSGMRAGKELRRHDILREHFKSQDSDGESQIVEVMARLRCWSRGPSWRRGRARGRGGEGA